MSDARAKLQQFEANKAAWEAEEARLREEAAREAEEERLAAERRLAEQLAAEEAARAEEAKKAKKKKGKRKAKDMDEEPEAVATEDEDKGPCNRCKSMGLSCERAEG